MLKQLTAICVSLILASCVSEPKEAEDLRVGQEYKTIGTPNPALRECTITITNIVTMVPTQDGVIPAKELYNSVALICGDVKCPQELGLNVQHVCTGLDIIQSPKKD